MRGLMIPLALDGQAQFDGIAFFSLFDDVLLSFLLR
jgi:hypothetical protein